MLPLQPSHMVALESQYVRAHYEVLRGLPRGSDWQHERPEQNAGARSSAKQMKLYSVPIGETTVAEKCIMLHHRLRPTRVPRRTLCGPLRLLNAVTTRNCGRLPAFPPQRNPCNPLSRLRHTLGSSGISMHSPSEVACSGGPRQQQQQQRC